MSSMPTPSTEAQPQTNRLGHSFARKIQAGFWVAGAILLLISFASYQSIREFDETVDWAAHSQKILVHLQMVLSDVQDIEIGLRGYVITGKERFLDAYNNGLDGLSRDRKVLSTTLREDPLYRPEQPQNLEKLEGLIEKKLALSNAMLALRKNVPYQSSEIELYMVESKGLRDAIRAVINDMQSLEQTRLIERDLLVDKHGRSAIQYFIVGVLIEIIILIWVAWQIRREISQRQQAQESLWRTHDELELRVQERTMALVDSNERLRELSHRLMNVQETERRQIAHDLHDEIGQSLTAMKLGLREADSVTEVWPNGFSSDR